MATLTTSWQKLGSATLTTGVTIYLYGKYTSQNQSNNTTTAIFQLQSEGYQWRTTNGTAKFTGDYTESKSVATYPSYITDGTVINEITKSIKHNSDGTKSISLGGVVTAILNGSTRKATISNVSITLPKIDRLATVTSASDFTDEENPTLSFSNPAGFIVYPYLNFYDDSNTVVYQLSRTDGSITSPYTWNITDEERSNLWQATNKQKSYKVTVGIDTYDGTTKLGYNSKQQTMTYVNAEPSQSTVFTETNQKVIDVLGSSIAETLIQNASKVKLTSTPILRKESTVSKILFEHNNISVSDTTNPYEYSFDVLNSNFKVTIVDSRGYSIPTEYTKTIIEYIPVNIDSFSFKRENPTSSNVILNSQISYKQTNFVTTANVPTIKWKLGADGTLNTLTTSDYTIDAENNKITISNLILENILPYTEENRFYLYVNDLLSDDTENEPVLRGIPTCDMGEHDFQVNGDLFVADTNRENKVNILEKINFLKTQKVLWDDYSYMTNTQTANLSENISDQPNGIVLVFCAYSNGEPHDWDWCTRFVPKQIVELKPGGGHDFNFNTPTYGHIGSKYLYISDDHITGHANNTASGSNNGVSYDNTYWVLRYVIGV